MRKFAYISLAAIISLALSFSSCSEDDFGSTIFIDSDTVKTTFDNWLDTNYRIPYNIEFKYRMEDIESDYDYNLVPARLDKSMEIAKIAKYLWFDVYDSICGSDFMATYAPRIIHLVGSPAINSSSNTIVLGTAEGGLKITLYWINNLDKTNIDGLNEYYFKTMHHEFAHILHQTKVYPQEFNLISATNYQRDEWQYQTDLEANSCGFVSPYARSENREDFVEIIANYLTKTPEQWEAMLERSRITLSKPEEQTDDNGNTTVVLVDDGVDGEAIIMQKFEIAKNWLRDAWNIDIDVLRQLILEREKEVPNINIDDLK